MKRTLVSGLLTSVGLSAATLSGTVHDSGGTPVVNASVVLGAVLLVFVLLVPRGVAPMVTERLVPWLFSLRRAAVARRPPPPANRMTLDQCIFMRYNEYSSTKALG